MSTHTPTDIARLLFLRLSGEISDADARTLREWELRSRSHRAVGEELGSEDSIRALRERRAADQASDIENVLLDRVMGMIASEEKVVAPVHRVHFLKTAWFRYAAAILLFIGIGAAVWMINQQANTPTVVTNHKTVEPKSILPGTNKAVLTLSGGRRVELDSATVETITDGAVKINNNNGELIYGKSDINSINTMTTPKGGQYQLTLADGTKVWLNAASSITYPTAFTNNRREVQITGEAYFEVAGNKSKPFIVKTISDSITVLGTEFNINAYADEHTVKTSLVNGSVKVNNQLLKIGQAFENGKVITTHINQDVAWKNGYFDFNGQDLPTVLRQIARWYNLDIKYEGAPPEKIFVGKMTRNVQLSSVLKLLEQLNVKYKINEQQLIILSK